NHFWRRVVPIIIQDQLITELHHSHHGINITFEMLSRQFFWPGMLGQVKRHILACRACVGGKRGQPQSAVLLKPLPIATSSYEVLQIDFLEGLPKTTEGFTSIMVIICTFSGYIYLHALKTLTSKEIAGKLLQTFSQSGLPSILITDSASGLVSAAMQELLEILRIRHVTCSPNLHRGSGRVERKIRDINNSLRTMLERKDYDRWNEFLPLFEMANRSIQSAERPFSPNEIIFGRQLRLPLHLTYGLDNSDLEVS